MRLTHAVELLGSALLGVSFVLAVYSLRSTVGTILVLLLPLAVICLWAAVAQGAPGISSLLRSAAWWQWLWLLLFLSDFTFRQRTSGEIQENPLDAWAAYRVALVATTAVVLAIRLALERPAWLGSLFRGLVGALAAYAVICAASTLWSSSPAWSLYKSLEYLVDLALLAATLATVTSAEAYRIFFNWTWALFGLLLGSVWLGALVSPALALEPSPGLFGFRLSGVLPQMDGNSVAECGAILAIVALSRLLTGSYSNPQRAWYFLLCMVGLVTLVLGQTRSAVGGFLLGVLVVLLFSKGKGITALIASTGAGALFVGGVRARLWEVISRGQTEEQFRHFSGRLELWGFAWHEILKSPIVGAGAYTARFGVVAKAGDPKSSGVLNTYVEILFGVGVLGLIPVLVALLGTWWLLIRSVRSRSLELSEWQLAVEALGVLSVVSVRSFITTHLIWHPSLQFLVVLGYAELLRRQYRQRGGTSVRTLTAIRR